MGKQQDIAIAAAADTVPAGDDSIFVTDFVIDCHIGVYAEEKGVTQKVRISVEAGLSPGVRAGRDEMDDVPSYADIIDGIEAIAATGHINLVETFAERIAAHCLADRRIARARVRIEKLERGPLRGVEIVRQRVGEDVRQRVGEDVRQRVGEDVRERRGR